MCVDVWGCVWLIHCCMSLFCSFGTDFSAIAKFVGTRSSTQVRTHAQKYYAKLVRPTILSIIPVHKWAFFSFFFYKSSWISFESECIERERGSEWEVDWFPKRPMHAEENSKPRKEKKKKCTEFLLGSTKYIARCLITKYLQQFCFSVGMECGWDTLWLLYLQIRDYKRSGKSGSATIKAGREEMKGATNRLTAMWLMIIRLDEREKNLSTTFSATPPPPNIKLCIWSYIGERERDKETHTDKETEAETEAWIG